jgi:hypothetical protein
LPQLCGLDRYSAVRTFFHSALVPPKREKFHKKMTPLILTLLLLFGVAFDASAATGRPPITGWYVYQDDTHPPKLFSTRLAAAEETCKRSFYKGIAYWRGDSLYCNSNESHQSVYPHWVSTPMLMETCPGYDQVFPSPWGLRCYDAPEKKPDCDCHGNPVRFASKEKLQFETDYTGPHGLEFTRYYSSTMLCGSWSHTYARQLTTNWRAYKSDVVYDAFPLFQDRCRVT